MLEAKGLISGLETFSTYPHGVQVSFETFERGLHAFLDVLERVVFSALFSLLEVVDLKGAEPHQALGKLLLLERRGQDAVLFTLSNQSIDKRVANLGRHLARGLVGQQLIANRRSSGCGLFAFSLLHDLVEHARERATGGGVALGQSAERK